VYIWKRNLSAAMFLFRHVCGSCARQEWPDGTNLPWPTVCRMLHDKTKTWVFCDDNQL